MRKILISLLLLSNVAFAQTLPDFAKEARWAEQVEDGIMDGDVVWLMANDHEFMSIYTPSETDSNKAAIIVHGKGVHPDWPQVIQVLRVALTEQGFNTLSLQMPVLENEADSHAYMSLLDKADARIQSALNYLKSESLETDVLIAHSFGGVMSTHFLTSNLGTVKRFVGIGMSDMTVRYLKNIKLPILDLYGDKDIQSVMRSAADRANTNNKEYTQKRVDADHFFNERNQLLIDEVSDWLK
ncbi:hypothetical protein BHECKSOX_2394 [Bathymodiolus heckerae thiotrophic gill symbiont]|uniref:DUF3530 family protein n=1 Tax=Bathymodiolus heckerae thiotrophic gill symbiont TaxID=1052212 RepID=UPI0010B3360C|nr:DUF3530 family protein [Bathymodiolus heckerae thiotrophic gill symbiont]CAC9544082.1 hypothetical protein [uncultured Gammaproteobacteria bacterium]SHN89815.1 hypothetical protein BHECKSOX_2394 [Bathymodiolus heckerae thiotrophic gill symbiont]